MRRNMRLDRESGLLIADSNTPQDLHCEAKIPLAKTQLRMECVYPATHVYGPECEATSGKLMYLCSGHAELIRTWKASHLFDPVECPTHGRIGMVRDYLILKEM